MDEGLPVQIAFYDRHRSREAPLALATIIATEGSTYRKAGARMLIAGDGEYAGLLSGGCLEGDLLEHARRVIDSGAPRVVRYDMRSAEDLVWGMGLGCEGAIDIFVQRLDPDTGLAPFDYIADCFRSYRRGAVGTVVRSETPEIPLGTSLCADAEHAAAPLQQLLGELREAMQQTCSKLRRYAGIEAFISPVYLPPRLLIAGAGPDALPLVETAARLGWRISLVDHRPAYARPERFPAAERVLSIHPEELEARLPAEGWDAAVVMSHHLPSDLAYLRMLAASPVRYIGLLGPPARRQRLFAELGERSVQFGARLFAPVGLDLGAQTPEAIALAIVAEIQAVLADRHGGHMSG